MPHRLKDHAGGRPQLAVVSDEQFAELKALLQPGYELSKRMLADYLKANPDPVPEKVERKHHLAPTAVTHGAPPPPPNPPAMSLEALGRNNEMAREAAAERAPEQVFKVDDTTGEIKPPQPAPVPPAPAPDAPVN